MSKRTFSIIFYSGVVFVCIIFLPSLIMPKSVTIFGGKLQEVKLTTFEKYILLLPNSQ